MAWLSRLFGLVLCACPPGDVPPDPSDNTVCHFDGYPQEAVRGRLCTSFDFPDGQCKVRCKGIDVDLSCEIDAGCSLEDVPPDPLDNTICHFEGRGEESVRGRLRMSFDYEGGQCRVDCTNIAEDLICEVGP
jgi:hypothetical protein